MNRFFVPKENIEPGRALITGEDVKHIAKVLRMRVGETLIVCDGASMQYRGTIAAMHDKEIELTLEEGCRCEAELPYELTVLQGLPKAGKMEWIVQKCTELGMHSLIPIDAARSVVRDTKKNFETKRLRYEKVAAEAAKQSQRGILPRVEGLQSFSSVDYGAYDLILLLYEEEKERTLKRALQALPSRPARVALVIGPEGGIEKEEARQLIANGAISVSLGKRILRTETAAMAAISMLQYAWDEV